MKNNLGKNLNMGGFNIENLSCKSLPLFGETLSQPLST